MKSPKRLDRKVAFKTERATLFFDKIRMPSGRVIENYHVLHFGHGVVEVIVENSKKQILLEYNYRPSVSKYNYETPAGAMEPGESPIQAARREVFEEVGYETHGHKKILTYHPLIGFSNSTVNTIYCKAGKRTGKTDNDEVSRFVWKSRTEVKKMIKSNLIIDGNGILGLMLWLNNYHKNK